MSYLRSFVLLCAMLLLLSPVFADEAEYGQVQGTVKFVDGLAGGIVPVSVQSHGETTTLSTKDDGSFSGLVKTGKAVITVNGTQVAATITAGEVTTVALKAPRPGWVVSANFPDKTPAKVSLYAACRYTTFPAGDVNKPTVKSEYQLQWKEIAPGRYWFMNLQEKALARLVVNATLQEGPVDAVFRGEWFLLPTERTLPLQVTHGVRVDTHLLDAGGKPLANTEVQGCVAYQKMVSLADIFSNDHPVTFQPVSVSLEGLHSDAHGMVCLGQLPQGQYTVTLTAGELAGKPVSFEVKRDGTATLSDYPLSLQARDVTQTVFTETGKPAPRALVRACYCWQGQAVYLAQRADAAGQVRWTRLPPVRTITWGDGLRAAVLPADGTLFDKPLPEPRAEGEYFLAFKVPNTGHEKMHLIGRMKCVASLTDQANNSFDPIDEQIVPPDEHAHGDVLEYEDTGREVGWFRDQRVVTASRLTLHMYAEGAAPGFVTITNAYIPYADTVGTEGPAVVCTLPLQRCADIHGRLLMPDGKPVAGVSRLRLELVQPDEALQEIPNTTDPFGTGPMYYYGSDSFWRITQQLQCHEQANGIFTQRVLVPGTYRVLVDLFDRLSPVPRCCYFQVKAGVNEVAITLPPPLLMAPAGTRVGWVTRTAPGAAKALTVAADAPAMPVFGPQEQMLAYWYSPAPDKLAVCDNATGQERRQTLSLRAGYFSCTCAAEWPLYQEAPRVFPLLPVAGAYNTSQPDQFEGYGWADISARGFLQPPATVKSPCWTGPYLYQTADGKLQRLPVTAEGAAEIAVSLPPPVKQGGPDGTTLQLAFPTLADPARAKLAAKGVSVTFDVPARNGMSYQQLSPSNDPARNQIVVPPLATKLTVQWLGVGVIREVSIPKLDTEHAVTLQLPEWIAGATLSGIVLQPDGKPLANSKLSISLGGQDGNTLCCDSRVSPALSRSLEVTTDTLGKFTVTGLLPGPLFLCSDKTKAGWGIYVPESGIAGIVLRMTEKPLKAPPGIAYYGGGSAWWLPDGEAPQLLPLGEGFESMHGITPGSGWLWTSDDSAMDTVMHRTLLVPGAESAVMTETVYALPLGLYFPLEPDAGLPGKVTLIGRGTRHGVVMTFDRVDWQPSALLGLVTAQINAVPPGDYLVRVHTTRGDVQAPANVTEQGGEVHLAYPAVGH